ncbi:hypothetical protein HJC23_000167 [Cyclotella cryptica]|uniref:Uncharacterized protein n=1 Tax=Cyclotella cryptica TaxID=29204 RepID=A0ABD3QE89_9STRA
MKIPAFSFLATFAAAASQHAAIDLDTGDIDASSQLGSLIMSKARALNNNNNNNNNNDVYYSWVSGYSIKFQQCFASSNYYGGYFGGNQNGDNNKNNNRNGFNGVYEQRLVHFKLCPSSSCSSSCENGADYVVDMNEFVNAYVESKLSVQEYNCERVRENCYCQNANNEQYCQSMCYQNAGLDYCGQYQNGGNNNNNKNNGQFNLQEALECRRLEVDDNAMQYYLYKNGGNLNHNAQNYYNYNQNQNNKMELFVGPYCANGGKKILLGVFMEETCSYAAPSGIYEKLFYGNKLPYSSDSLVTNSCVDCKEPDNYDNKNNNDQQDADKVLDVCQRLYEDAGKCESSLSSSIPYPNTYACDFIKTLPKVSRWSISKSAAVPAKALAGVFAITTVALGALTVFLHRKVAAKSGLAQGLSPTDAELA